MKRKIILLYGVVIILFCLAALTGCRWWQRAPERSPGPETQKDAPEVAIPDPINQGEKVEPEISVYLAEENRVQAMKIEEYLQGVVAAEMDLLAAGSFGGTGNYRPQFYNAKISEDGGVPERNAHASTDIQEFQAATPAY